MIRNIVIDCDGCLTDGRKYTSPDGQRGLIAFHARDNEAARRLIADGYRVIVVTASQFSGIRRYWHRYGVEVHVLRDKGGIFDAAHLTPSETLGIGDDLRDVPFLEQCAESYCPADAHHTVRQRFNRLLKRGGHGVLEEVESMLAGRVIINAGENGYTTT